MDLHNYIRRSGATKAAFARQIGVSCEAVRRYVAGTRFPTPSIMARIAQATEGRVTANDFVRAHEARVPEIESFPRQPRGQGRAEPDTAIS